MPRKKSSEATKPSTVEIKPKRKYTRRNIPAPLLPLSRHGCIPTVLRMMEDWRGMTVDGTFIERIRGVLEGERVPERVRDILDRVKFNGEAVENFDSRKFYHLANILLWEVESVIDGEAVRGEIDDVKAGMWIEGNWSESRLTMLI